MCITHCVACVLTIWLENSFADNIIVSLLMFLMYENWLSVSKCHNQRFWSKAFLSPRNYGVTNRFWLFPGLPAKEVASSLTTLGVVKTDGRKGEVMHSGYY